MDMLGDITLKNRPLRLAFLIEPKDEQLQKAIQVNSSLWGGTYNPIVVLHTRAPKEWQEYPRQKVSVKDRTLGYIRAFDPDILVKCGTKELPSYLLNLNRPIVNIDDIWAEFSSPKKEWSPKYGVGVFELLNSIYKDLFETKRRFPYTISLPVLPESLKLFWSSVLGELPADLQTAIEKEYSEALDIEKPTITISSYKELLKERTLFPRRIVRHRLEEENMARFNRDSYAFYMDAEKLLDIVDFWNLRALGRKVLPVPKQLQGDADYLELIKGYVKSEYGVSRHNPQLTFGTSFIRSFSTTMDELTVFANTLDIRNLIPNQPDARSVTLQHWYPRIWDEWAMGKDSATPNNIFSETKQHTFPDTDGNVSFDLLAPDFLYTTFSDTPRYANELYPKFYGDGKMTLADILPYDYGKEVLRVAGGMSFGDEFRIGRTGLIRLVSWKSRAYWKVPAAEDVFFAWLKDKGFTAELSSCGLLAKQVHVQLDGWVGALTNEPLLNVLDTMSKGDEESGKGMEINQVKNTLQASNPAGTLYKSLVERKVFRLGYQAQCPKCGRSSWYGLEKLSGQLSCPLCYETLDFINTVGSGTWRLKATGPFSVGKSGDGSYSVLLSVNFFERLHSHSLQTTPVLSFKAKKSPDIDIEADFGLFWQETMYGETKEGVLFGECKSYNKFKRVDFTRMRQLAKQFPGAILVFATLRKTLEVNELDEIRKIALKGVGKKPWKAERPINPVLILTGNELFNTVGPPYCWNDLPNVTDFAKNHARGLLDICNASQQIYLGLPHWDETWRKEYEKTVARRKGGSSNSDI